MSSSEDSNLPCTSRDRRLKRQRRLRHARESLRNDRSWNPKHDDSIGEPRDDFTLELLPREGKKPLFNSKVYRFQPLDDETADDEMVFIEAILPTADRLIAKNVRPPRQIKAQLRLSVKFKHSSDPERKAVQIFNPKAKEVIRSNDVHRVLLGAATKIHEQIDSFICNGSGWVMENIGYCDLYITPTRKLRGRGFIPTPCDLRGSTAIVNVKCNDNMCFMWSVLAKLYPVTRNANRPTKYFRHTGKLNFNGIPFPVAVGDIGLVEDQNSMAVNVFGYERKELYPIRITTKRVAAEKVVNLLLLRTHRNSHYCLIKKLNRLLHSHTGRDHQQFFCPYCLVPYANAAELDEHIPHCDSEQQRVSMPKNLELCFTRVKNQLMCPLVLVADFECFLQKLSTAIPNPLHSSTTPTHVHKPNSVAVCQIRCCGCNDLVSTFNNLKTISGRKCVRQFLQYILDVGSLYQMQLDDFPSLETTDAEDQQHERSTCCHVCKLAFTEEQAKAKDHCHICGQFRGSAHVKCNLGYSGQRDIPVFFHNLRKYDGHILMEEIGGFAREHNLKITATAKTTEDYLEFSLCVPRALPEGKSQTWRLRFIDSCAFLSCSLAGLVENLAEKDLAGKHKFKALHTFVQDAELQSLLLRKGVYPYEYVDSVQKFEEKHLPPPEAFKNTLTSEEISESDYQHALNVWRVGRCKTFWDYHKLYLKSDVMLLADVVQNFRVDMHRVFGLDPAHYITLPSYSWDCLLKFTGVKLALLSDARDYMFWERGIRGGISTICGRYAKANNPYLPTTYDNTKPNSFIMYLDANNQYGWAMSQPLPLNNWRWLAADEIEVLDIINHPDDHPTGYVLEVDLDYPDTLHLEHNDYPLAPESLLITEDMLSPFSNLLKDELHHITMETKKLTPNLRNKQSYILHYRNLKLYLSLGLVLRRIHKVLSFGQSKWMEPYIRQNTDLRKLAKSPFSKDLHKLMNNSVFGKSMQNVRKYKDIRLVWNPKKLRQLRSHPLYEQEEPFSKDLVAVVMGREKVTLDKPIFTGFAVLDISKTLLYEFHYRCIKPLYGPRAHLLFTDTDSLCYLIETEDIFSDILENLDWYDTSDYPTDHRCRSDANKKVLGKMKDEMCSRVVQEFVGLRSKMYSLLVDNTEKKRAKGVTRNVVEKVITHQNYVDALFNRQSRVDIMTRFNCYHHQITTVRQVKKSLCPYDDKRYVLSNGIETLAHGHFMTQRIEDVVY